MDTENSTSLYLQVCQTLLTCNYDKPSSFTDLYKFLPWLRQSLTCCVCSNVARDPMSSTESACQHFICARCFGKPMILKPSCSWCKDYTYFERNGHLAILVMCFAKICEFVANSPVMDHIEKQEKDQTRQQNLEECASTDTIEKSHKMVHKKKSKNRKKVYTSPRRRYKQLTLSLSRVLEDGLAIKSDLLDWIDNNVVSSTDTQHIEETYLRVQSELCLDTNALLHASLDLNDESNEETLAT